MRRLVICQGWQWGCVRKGVVGGSTVGIPSSTCKNVLTVRTQTQTQLSTASMRVGADRGTRFVAAALPTPRRGVS